MREYSDNHRRLFDGGDDLQGAATLRAVFEVDSENGRTNLKDYFNLNFDPNDAILIGAGTRAIPHTTLSAFQIRDDRLGTGQRVFHVVARIKPDDRTRWTIDAFHKEGRASADDEVTVRATGVSVTYDFDRYFVRLASDPHVNFSRDHRVRLSMGRHF